MNVEVISESPVDLDEYARVSIGFTVAEVLDDAAVDAALRGGPIAAVPLEVPYEKNYDSHPGSRPADWRAGFDIAEWQFVAAFLDGRRVGGAVLIPNGRVGVGYWMDMSTPRCSGTFALHQRFVVKASGRRFSTT